VWGHALDDLYIASSSPKMMRGFWCCGFLTLRLPPNREYNLILQITQLISNLHRMGEKKYPDPNMLEDNN
jgi:hypothetical protein